MANSKQRRIHLRESAKHTAQLRSSAAPVRIVGAPLPDSDGYRWPIVIIRAGESANAADNGLHFFYTPEALQEAANNGVFEGAKSYRDHPSKWDEANLPERSIDDVIGFVNEVRYDPASQELRAVWNVVDESTKSKVLNANRLGKLDLIGFSINAFGQTERGTREGREYELVTSLKSAPGARPSVDAVTEPAAGGNFLTRLAASLRASANKEQSAMKKNWKWFAEAKAKLAEAVLRAATDSDAVALVDSLELFTEAEKADRDAFVQELGAERTKLKASAAPVAAPVAPVPAAAPPPNPGSCGACGAPLMEGAKFCGTCGVKMEAAAPPHPNHESAKVGEAVSAANAALTEARKLTEAVRASAHAAAVAEVLTASGFDTATIADIRPQVEKAATREEMTKLVEARRAYLATVREAGTSFGFPTGTRRDSGVEVGSDGWDKYLLSIDGFFANEDQKTKDGITVPRVRSVKEAIQRHPKNGGRYVEVMPLDILRECQSWFHGGYRRGEQGTFGLRESGGVRKLTESNGTWLRESVTTSGFGEVWADRAYKRMMSVYSSSNDVKELEAWASDKEELDDFKTHRIIRLGEYANPGSVAEGGTYAAASTPGDNEEATSLTKYGFYEDITMESLLGEDGKKLRSLPDRMIAAVLRLERQTIINRITTTNPTLNSDSVALYHAGTHVNLLTTALSVAQLAVIERAMMQQTSLTAGEQLGTINRPWGIIIPPEHLQLVERIVNPSVAYTVAMNTDTNTVLDPHLFKGRLKVLVADHFTNATDYYLMADPKKMPTFQISRLRGVGGPEFFTQDSDDSESQFNADKIKWKVRTFLGVEPLDYRSFHFSDVA